MSCYYVYQFSTHLICFSNSEILGNELADLNDRVIGLQQARDQEKDQFDQQLQTLKTEHQEMKDKLTSENMLLGIFYF